MSGLLDGVSSFMSNLWGSSSDSPSSSIGSTIGGIASSLGGNVPPDLGGAVASSVSGNGGGGLLDQFFNSLLSPQGITGLLGGAASLLKGNQELKLAEQQQARQDAAAKLQAAVELAKLKYSLTASGGGGGRRASGGGSGGGGGSSAASKAQLITALASQKQGIGDSLSSLGSNLAGAYG